MRSGIMNIMLCLLCLFLGSKGAFAQTDDDQLLIFRNTGETNLLYQSKLDSITLTKIDAQGVEHEDAIAQVFHTADTALYVPLAEIDSVCIGSRNEIEFRADVRVLEEPTDMQWIVRYDGKNIYYKVDTPADVLPVKGQKLYFPEQTDIFPCGLCAKVDNVVRGGEEIAVAVSSVDYTEVFSKFFYAGSMDGVSPAMAKAQRAKEVDKGETLKSSIDIGEYGELAVDGRIGVHGDVVLKPFKHYYHAVIEIENVLGLSLKAKAKESAEYNFEHNFLTINFPPVAAIFLPSVDVGLFVDMSAELAFEYAMDRKVTTRLEWTRQDGKQEFKRSNPTEDGKQGNTAKMQIVLDGSIYAGLQTAFNFNLVGDVIGATAKLKYGTDFNGELGFGMLADLSKAYDVSVYGKAELALQSKAKLEGIVRYRTGWLFQDEHEETILEYEHVFCEGKIDLFPEFFEPKAVATPAKDEVTVAVKSKNEIAHEVETGFQIVESKENPIPVDSIFVKNIEVRPEEVVQGVATEMPVPESVAEKDSVVLRPVFHYAGYTIPHDLMTAATDPNIQPIIFCMTNGGCTLVSGVPFADNVNVDGTTYVIGPYVPVAHNDTVFHEKSPYADIREAYLYYEDAVNLIGTWKGKIEDEDVAVTFSENDSCCFQCVDTALPDAMYRVNEPQSGCVIIESADNSVVLEIVSVTEDVLIIRFKNTKHKGMRCELRKQ